MICEPSHNHHQLNTTDEDDALYYGIVPKLEPTIDIEYSLLVCDLYHT